MQILIYNDIVLIYYVNLFFFRILFSHLDYFNLLDSKTKLLSVSTANSEVRIIILLLQFY